MSSIATGLHEQLTRLAPVLRLAFPGDEFIAPGRTRRLPPCDVRVAGPSVQGVYLS